jgi:excisionase family DNA binding protein
MQQRFLRVHEAARVLGLTEAALRMRLARGHVPFTKLGTSVLIPVDALDALVAKLSARAHAS